MNILIIPEDFRNDQYILKPLFYRLFLRIGITSPQVRVCQNPRLRGISDALTSERIAHIVRRYQGETDVFVLCVDRDGDVNRRVRLGQIEREFEGIRPFFAENAWEEIETWVLAGLDLPSEWRWSDVRTEIQVKERYFEPLAVQRGLSDTLGGGRDALGREAARRVPAIRQKCPEDFDTLAQRLHATIAQQ